MAFTAFIPKETFEKLLLLEYPSRSAAMWIVVDTIGFYTVLGHMRVRTCG